jgi:hypothetical protein
MSGRPYNNPYPNYASRYAPPYSYPGGTLDSALRWGLSRGALFDALLVNSVSPNSGTTAGGTTVTIFGAGFRKGAGVNFGSSALTNVVVLDSHRITGVTSAHGAGAVNVVVTNPGGANFTLPNGYTYV